MGVTGEVDIQGEAGVNVQATDPVQAAKNDDVQLQVEQESKAECVVEEVHAGGKLLAARHHFDIVAFFVVLAIVQVALFFFTWGKVNDIPTPLTAFLRFLPPFVFMGGNPFGHFWLMIQTGTSDVHEMPPVRIRYIALGMVAMALWMAFLTWLPVYMGFLPIYVSVKIWADRGSFFYLAWKHGKDKIRDKAIANTAGAIWPVAVVGVLAAVFYPWVSRYVPSALSGIGLSAVFFFAEKAGLVVCMRAIKKAPDSMKDRNTFIWAALNSFAFVPPALNFSALMSGVLEDPESLGWFSSLITNLLLGVGSRTFWLSYAMVKLTGRNNFAPTAVSLQVQYIKFGSSYWRMSFPLGLMLGRLALGVEEWYFNRGFIMFLSALAVFMLVEDVIVLAMGRIGLMPNWSFLKDHYDSMGPDERFSRAFRFDSDGKQEQNLTYVLCTRGFDMLCVYCFNVASSFVSTCVLMGNLSMAFLLGNVDVASPNSSDGLFYNPTANLQCC